MSFKGDLAKIRLTSPACTRVGELGILHIATNSEHGLLKNGN